MKILLCKPGDKVTPVHEPKNPSDANAIAVYSSRGVQIGCMVAHRTNIIHRACGDARDVRAIFQEPIVGGAAIRVAFDRDHVLPPQSKRSLPRRGVGEWDGVDYISPDD